MAILFSFSLSLIERSGGNPEDVSKNESSVNNALDMVFGMLENNGEGKNCYVVLDNIGILF